MKKEKILSLALRKIEFAFGLGNCSKPMSERRLMCGVVSQAVRDLYSSSSSVITVSDRCSAISYLSGEMPHAECCGVNSEYIRRILRGFGFDIAAAKFTGHGIDAPIDRSKWQSSVDITNICGD